MSVHKLRVYGLGLTTLKLSASGMLGPRIATSQGIVHSVPTRGLAEKDSPD